MLNSVTPTLEFSYDDDDFMPIRDPDLPPGTIIQSRKGRPQIPEDDQQEEYTLEQEIIRMQYYKKELIHKMGGDRYNKTLERLVKRKQKSYKY